MNRLGPPENLRLSGDRRQAALAETRTRRRTVRWRARKGRVSTCTFSCLLRNKNLGLGHLTSVIECAAAPIVVLCAVAADTQRAHKSSVLTSNDLRIRAHPLRCGSTRVTKPSGGCLMLAFA